MNLTVPQRCNKNESGHLEKDYHHISNIYTHSFYRNASGSCKQYRRAAMLCNKNMKPQSYKHLSVAYAT